jgi:TonB family protein
VFFHKASRGVALALFATALYLSAQPIARNDISQPSSNYSPAPGTWMALELMTQVGDTAFDKYLQTLYLSVKKSWMLNMPDSAQLGERGQDEVEFQVLQDGTVPKDSIKLSVSSRKKDLDEASLRAIRKAGPFDHLPDKFMGRLIDVQITFGYNVPRPTH